MKTVKYSVNMYLSYFAVDTKRYFNLEYSFKQSVESDSKDRRIWRVSMVQIKAEKIVLT